MNLVYITAWSSQFKLMASYCVKTLRKAGCFEGDIIVVTDAMDSALEKVAHLCRVICWPIPSHVRYHRWACFPILEHEKYDGIMNMDADCLAFRDITPLFRIGDLQYAQEPWQTIRRCDSIYTAAMTDRDRTDFADRFAINVGNWACHSTMFQDVCEKMLRYSEQDNGRHGWDQACWNAMINRGEVMATPFEQYDIANGLMTPQSDWRQYRICHLAGDANRLVRMRRISRE